MVNSAVAKVKVYQVLKLLFDERVKFLGSLVEMGIYRVSGILINDYGWMIRFAKDGWMDMPDERDGSLRSRDGWMSRSSEKANIKFVKG